MNQRTSVSNVRNAFTVAKRNAEAVGVDTSLWLLREGSSTYGNAWAIVNRDPETGALSTVRVFGVTRSDAYEGLHSMSAAFRLVYEV